MDPSYQTKPSHVKTFFGLRNLVPPINSFLPSDPVSVSARPIGVASDWAKHWDRVGGLHLSESVAGFLRNPSGLFSGLFLSNCPSLSSVQISTAISGSWPGQEVVKRLWATFDARVSEKPGYTAPPLAAR